MLELLTNWLAAYALHSTVFVALVWGLDRSGALRRLAHAELAWRWALFGPLLTASVPLLIGLGAERPEDAATTAPPVAARIAPTLTPTPAAPTTTAPGESIATSATSATSAATAAPPADVATLPWRALARPAALLWLAGAVAGLGLLCASALWLAAAVKRLPRNDDAEIEAAILRLSRRAAVRPPRLRANARWRSPLLTPGGTICLPRWTARLDAPQREAVLAHEMAHLLRHDPAWRVAAQAVVRLTWLQPLNRLALRRLDTLAELACDAWAARVTGSPVPLAESLLHAAEQRQGRQAPRLASAMNRRRSPLAQRLHRLLEGDAMSEQKPAARKTRWIIAACVLTAAVAVPAIAIRGTDANAGEIVASLMDRLGDLGGHAFSVFHNGSTTRIETHDDAGRLSIELHGTLQFNEAEDTLTGVDGQLDVRDTHGGHKRHLRITGKPLQRSFERDGAVAIMDASDDAWFDGMVDLLVQSTVSADEQVRVALAHGGVPAVLARIERVPSDSARSALIQALLKSGPQDDATKGRLIALLDHFGGDYDRRMCLQALAGQPLPDVLQLAWLQAVGGIHSDFDSRTALASLAPQLSATPDVIQAWQKVVQQIHSDFDARTTVEAQMQALDKDAKDASGRAPAALVEAALAVTTGLHSDFDHRTALATIAQHMDKTDATEVQAYANSAAAINSDFDRREALVALVQTGQLKPEGYSAVLGAATAINSSFDTLTVLNAVAERMPADTALIARYRQVARKLSDFERGQAEKAIDHLEEG